MFSVTTILRLSSFAPREDLRRSLSCLGNLLRVESRVNHQSNNSDVTVKSLRYGKKKVNKKFTTTSGTDFGETYGLKVNSHLASNLIV